MNDKQKEDALKRLNKIEGQIRGINKMVNDERYCIDILTQTSAVVSAIKRVEDLIMEQHLRTCVAESMISGKKEDKDKKIKEIMDLVSRFRKNT